ncbi:MAG TPA: TonB-dependent receptor plug domain-containing protein [Thermoanaerobaculia bacterium]|nr:TonB-dependent receptor plug domain-containing protein [Thermoanaerobaculia bacterium]
MNVRVLIVSLLVLSTSAFAQTATPPAAAPEQPRTYVPADFAQFAPRTALDMLNRVPGFGIKQEDLERGLGEATGNVVINGQRISGKSNDVVTELSRIPAENVERIEIVDGATLEIPGLAGQVANVIVRSKGITGQWAYRPEFRSYYTDPLFTRFEVSLSGTKGPVEYTIGVDNRGNRSGAGGPTWIYTPDGVLTEERAEEWRGNTDRPRASARFVYDGPGTSKGNLNLSYGRLYFDYLETGSRNTVNGVNRERRVTVDEHGDDYEIGADYEFALGFGRMKVIGVGRGSRYPNQTDVITTSDDGSAAVAERFTQVGDEQEIIGRAEYRWTSGGAEWQLSAEGAYNSLDNVSRLFAMQPDGSFAEQELTGGIASVEEDRYEVVGSYGRPLSSTVTMKLSAGGEYSQLAQVGAGGTTRTFYRPKGELSAAWKASSHTDINFKLARRVGQLNFFDFLASVDLQADIETSANPDLVPEQSWDLDMEGSRNLGTLGSTTLRVYARLIDDIIDYIPIGATGESPGNLDSATMYGIHSRSTFNLDRIGWRGARVDVTAQLQRSEVEDPLTGEHRPISNALQELASLGLRHDIAGTDWAWGGGASYQLYAKNYRLTEVGRLWEGPLWADLYLENKNVRGLTVRAGIANVLAADSMWDRTVFTGRRTGSVDFVEERDRQIGPIFTFQVRGKF